ncbi:hypothetical protein PTSG_09410 [Salpingoeca rosetta]|uniref:SH2 domain-containing protein n=1 Tax=Salpingoeca rosetta (strain ATCC 50818 / BSB-021) TaxID=946362 RepID=F2UMJ5_SALR5|nr:uncharacterized protein PTSG_09410 [Salpingoeca rosetta]EGD78344.1 hypothetical protein PTSG_09410 [Salpingoeca rosetta]|eukprot:XP_004989667.1 hypothetical protein PTSG_09410 [Salpingoeca rosetta]
MAEAGNVAAYLQSTDLYAGDVSDLISVDQAAIPAVFASSPTVVDVLFDAPDTAGNSVNGTVTVRFLDQTPPTIVFNSTFVDEDATTANQTHIVLPSLTPPLDMIADVLDNVAAPTNAPSLIVVRRPTIPLITCGAAATAVANAWRGTLPNPDPRAASSLIAVDAPNGAAYSVDVTVSDAAGNEAVASVVLEYADHTPPNLTLLGETRVVLDLPTSFVEAGAVAFDNRLFNDVLICAHVDRFEHVADASACSLANVTVVASSDSGNGGGENGSDGGGVGAAMVRLSGADPGASGGLEVLQIGLQPQECFVVTYTADDGVQTTTRRRVVYAKDTQPPTVFLQGEKYVQVAYAHVFVDPGAFALDAVEGVLQASVHDTVDRFQVGVYTVRYEAVDSSGNSNYEDRQVEVLPLRSYTGMLRLVLRLATSSDGNSGGLDGGGLGGLGGDVLNATRIEQVLASQLAVEHAIVLTLRSNATATDSFDDAFNIRNPFAAVNNSSGRAGAGASSDEGGGAARRRRQQQQQQLQQGHGWVQRRAADGDDVVAITDVLFLDDTLTPIHEVDVAAAIANLPSNAAGVSVVSATALATVLPPLEIPTTATPLQSTASTTVTSRGSTSVALTTTTPTTTTTDSQQGSGSGAGADEQVQLGIIVGVAAGAGLVVIVVAVVVVRMCRRRRVAVRYAPGTSGPFAFDKEVVTLHDNPVFVRRDSRASRHSVSANGTASSDGVRAGAGASASRAYMEPAATREYEVPVPAGTMHMSGNARQGAGMGSDRTYMQPVARTGASGGNSGMGDDAASLRLSQQGSARSRSGLGSVDARVYMQPVATTAAPRGVRSRTTTQTRTESGGDGGDDDAYAALDGTQRTYDATDTVLAACGGGGGGGRDHARDRGGSHDDSEATGRRATRRLPSIRRNGGGGDEMVTGTSTPWFHPHLDRMGAEQQLREAGGVQGMFLVRLRAQSGDAYTSYALSVMTDGRVLHHLLVRTPDGFTVNGAALVPACRSLPALVERLMLPNPTGVLLTRPCLCEVDV